MTQHASNSNKPNGASATEDLLNANVLPHLPQPEMKVSYLSHLVGLLLNYLFLPAARHSLQYDNFGTDDQTFGIYYQNTKKNPISAAPNIPAIVCFPP